MFRYVFHTSTNECLCKEQFIPQPTLSEGVFSHVVDNDEMQDGYIGFAKEDNESVDLVMNIVHKYQKIKQIYEKFQKDGHYDSYMAWSDVKKVVEDGNNNR